MNQRIASFAILSAASLVPPGCGGGTTRIPVFPAGGTVQFAGRPAAKAVILFHPVSPKISPEGDPGVTSTVAEIDDEGRYRLSTYEAEDGAPAGDYVVTVRPGDAPSVEDGDGRARSIAPSATLTKYSVPATSPLKATIKPGDNRFDFDLK